MQKALLISRSDGGVSVAAQQAANPRQQRDLQIAPQAATGCRRCFQWFRERGFAGAGNHGQRTFQINV